MESLALARGSKVALFTSAAVTYIPAPQAQAPAPAGGGGGNEERNATSLLPKVTGAASPPSSSHPQSHPHSYRGADPPPPPPLSSIPPPHSELFRILPPSPPLPSSPAVSAAIPAAITAVEVATRPGREQGGRYITSFTPNKDKRPQPQPQAVTVAVTVPPPSVAARVTAQQSAPSYSIAAGGDRGGAASLSSSSAKSTPSTTPKAGAPHHLDWKKQFVQGLVSRGQDKGGYKDAAAAAAVSTGTGAPAVIPPAAIQTSVVATSGKQMTKTVTAAAVAANLVVDNPNRVEPGSPISHPSSANAPAVQGSSKPKSWSQAVAAGGGATTSITTSTATAHVNSSSSSNNSSRVTSRGGGETEKRKPVTTAAGSAAAGAKKQTTKPKGATITTTPKKKTSEGIGNDVSRVNAEASSQKEIQLTSVDEFPSLGK